MNTRRKNRYDLMMLAAVGVFAVAVAEVRGINIRWTAEDGHWLVPDNWGLQRGAVTTFSYRATRFGDTIRLGAGADVLLDDDPPAGGASWPADDEIAIERLWMGGGTNVLTFAHSRTVSFTGTSIDFIGEGSNTDSTVNMVSGTWNLNAALHVGHGGAGTLNVYGGTINVGNHVNIGYNNGTGTVNMYGGLLDIARHNSLSIGATRGEAGTLNTYGGTVNVGWNFSIGAGDAVGTLNMHSGATVNPGPGRALTIGGDQAGTFRAWLDGSEFNPLTITGGGGHLALGDHAHLDVAFPGGLMLSATNEYDLIKYSGNLTGRWLTEPGKLWNTTTADGAVTVKLSDGRRRGALKLDAGHIGHQSWLGGAANDRVQYVDGHVDVGNLQEGTGNLLQLALGFADDPSDYEDEDGVDFVTALQQAGYAVWGEGDDERNLPLDLIDGYDSGDVGRLVGLDMLVEMESGDTEGHFAWDTSRYTNGNGSLQIESITVITEP